MDLYVSRLVFDGFLGFGVYKRKPSDIDAITVDKNHRICFIEIKEKDKCKSSPIGFGIDVPRLEDCLELSRNTGLSYQYMVRHIDDQSEENLSNGVSIEL